MASNIHTPAIFSTIFAIVKIVGVRCDGHNKRRRAGRPGRARVSISRVRFGSKADIRARNRDVRFTPKSRRA